VRDEVNARNLVHGEIDSANQLRRCGIRGMAGAAELPFEGLLRHMRTRLHLVFRGRFMANLAVEGCMRGDGLGPGDGVVARGALLNSLRWRRVVCVVAAGAGPYRVVPVLDDLGEAGRSRRQVAVAREAGFPPRRHLRAKLHGIGRVVARRPVARFAAHGSVEGLVLRLYLVRVAHRALLPARVARLQSRVGFHRSSPVVTQIPEGFGNELLPQQEHTHANNHKDDAELDDLNRNLPGTRGHAPSLDPCSQSFDRFEQSSNHFFPKQREEKSVYIRLNAGTPLLESWKVRLTSSIFLLRRKVCT